ncbi:MAG TPA: hypothetical protein DEH78_07400 [Solibacterales bacterium]|nr:hypothetical protein [Bryobacterales bacterium]
MATVQPNPTPQTPAQPLVASALWGTLPAPREDRAPAAPPKPQPKRTPLAAPVIYYLQSILLALLLAAPLPLEAKKISVDVPSSGQVDVIVQYRQTPGAAALDRLQRLGGQLRNRFRSVPAASVTLPAAALAALDSDPDVTYVTPDRKVKGSLEYASPAVGAAWAYTFGWTGGNVGVAVIDSGVNAHADVRDRIVYSENFVPGSTTSADLYGHGTHVAGIVAGNASESSGGKTFRTFRGVAPGARIINLRVLDASGAGSDSAVIAAIDRAIDLKQSYNIRVINLSLGRPIFESYRFDPLCQAVERAWRAGMVVVVAAGNGGRDNSAGTSGYGTIASPANHPMVITVGAMKDMGTASRSDDRIASYSSKGPTLVDQVVKPDLVAPGNLMIAAGVPSSRLQQEHPENIVASSYYSFKSSGDGYYRLSGTSMAAPMVAGAAALLIQKDPNITPDLVKARLMKTAYKSFPTSTTVYDSTAGAYYTTQYDIFAVGAGYLDVWAALNNNDTLPAGASALSPRAVRSESGQQVTLVNDNSVMWGSSVLWGNSVLWGSSVVWGSSVLVSNSSILWGSSVCWGSRETSGYSVIWGTSVLWGVNSEPFAEALSIRGENGL